jgi:uncharacterized protein
MYVEVGPASISVSGDRDGKAFEFEMEKLEGWIREILKDVKECLPILRQKAFRIKKTGQLPEVARKMVEAVKTIDEATLTPMAAIAGAVADALKERCQVENLDFISINNGGDISIGNRSGRLFRIGLGDINKGRATPYVLSVEGLKDCGIASSGFGGRSFTLGLANMVTILAETGAVADAAATFVCNNTNAETDLVIRRVAYDIDPLTDIPDELVTVSIGELNKDVIVKALDNGLHIARKLKILKCISEAVIVLKGDFVTTIDEQKNVKLEVQNGDSEDCHCRGGSVCGR